MFSRFVGPHTREYSQCKETPFRGEEILPDIDNKVSSFVKDTNASALNASLDLALQYSEFCMGASDFEIAKKMSQSIINGPAMSSCRPTTSQLTREVLFKLVEVGSEGLRSAHVVVGCLLSDGLQSRKPKVVAKCLSLALDCSRSFGPFCLPLDIVCSSVPKALSHSNLSVREAAINILAEICRLFGSKEPIRSVIDTMKASQLTQLEKLLSEQSVSSTPLISFRNKDISASFSPQTFLAEMEAKRFASREAINLFKNLSSSDYKVKMKLPKWSEKVSAMKIVLECGGSKPYKLVAPSSDAPYNILICDVKQLLSHTHFSVNCHAMDVLGMLASGVGEKLAPLLRPFVSLLIDMSKDKKVAGAVNRCLDNFYGNVFSLASLMEADMIPQSLNERKQKNPLARSTGLSFLSRALNRYEQSLFNNRKRSVADVDFEVLSELVAAKLSDTDPSPRKVAADIMKTLLVNEESKMFANVSMEKIKTSKPRVYKSIISHLKKNDSDDTTKQIKDNSRHKTDKTIPQDISKGKPKALLSAEEERVSSSKVSSDSNEGVEISYDEALDSLQSSDIPNWNASEDENGIILGLRSNSWKHKNAAIVNLTTYMRSCIDGKLSVPYKEILVIVKQNTKELRQSNVNLTKSIFEMLLNICEIVYSLALPLEVWLCKIIVPVVVEKIADRKLADIPSSILLKICELALPDKIIPLAIKKISEIKSPLYHEAFLKWILKFLSEFGAHALSSGMQEIANWCLKECENNNSNIRKASYEIVGEMYSQLGPLIQAIAISSDAKVKSQLELTFKNSSYDPNSSSKERSRSCLVNKKSFGNESSIIESTHLSIQIPRLHLSTELTKDCLTNMGTKDGKNSWKIRKSAMDEVETALSKSNGMISTAKKEMNYVISVAKALRERLGDSQSNLKPVAASLLGKLLSSVDGPSQSRLGKLVFPMLLSGALSDNRKPMRDTCIIALENATTKLAIHNGGTNSQSMEVMMNVLPSCLKDSQYKAVGTPEVLNIFTHKSKDLPKLKIMKSAKAMEVEEDFAKHVVFCLTSSKKETRSNAERLLDSCLSEQVISFKSIERSVKGMPQAQQRSINGALEKLSIHRSDLQQRSDRQKELVMKTEQKDWPVNDKGTPRKKSVSSSSTTSRSRVATAKMQHITEKTVCNDEDLDSKRRTTIFLLCSNTSLKVDHWPEYPEVPTNVSLLNHLKKPWSPALSTSSQITLFPPNGILRQDDAIDGIATLERFLDDESDSIADTLQGHLELVCAWLSFVLCCRENTVGLQTLLSFVHKLFSYLMMHDIRLGESDIPRLVPQLLERGSIAKGRFRVMYKKITEQLFNVVDIPNYIQLCCIPIIESSQYFKARILAMEHCENSLQSTGLASFGKRGVHLFCKALDEASPESRSCAISFLTLVKERLNNDQARFFRACGSALSSKGRQELESVWSKGNRKMKKLSSPKKTSMLTPPTSSKKEEAFDSESIRPVKQEFSLNLRLGELPQTNKKLHLDKDSPSSRSPFKFHDPTFYSGSPDIQNDDGRSYNRSNSNEASDSLQPLSPLKSDAALSLRARLKQIRDKHRTRDNGISEIHTDSEPVEKSKSNTESYAVEKSKSNTESDQVNAHSTDRTILTHVDILLSIVKIPLAENDEKLNNCIKSLNELHLAISNPASNTHRTSIRKLVDEELLQIIDRLTRILSFAFRCLPLDKNKGICTNLVMVTLAVLLSIFRDPVLANKIDDSSLSLLIGTSSKLLLDSRLTVSSGSTESLDASIATQLVRAVNKLVIQSAICSPRHISFKSLISLQLEYCTNMIPESKRLSKVMTKLFGKVLKVEESRGTDSFLSIDLESTICAFDDCLISCGILNQDGAPAINMVDTFIIVILHSRGSNMIKKVMTDAGIDLETSQLGLRLKHVVEKEKIENSSTPSSIEDKRLTHLTNLVSNISLADSEEERVDAIHKLYRWSLSNNDVDLNLHLSQLSKHFRTYIFETLASVRKKEDSCKSRKINVENKIDISSPNGVADRIASLKSRLASSTTANQGSTIGFDANINSTSSTSNHTNTAELRERIRATTSLKIESHGKIEVKTREAIQTSRNRVDAAANLRARLEAVKRSRGSKE